MRQPELASNLTQFTRLPEHSFVTGPPRLLLSGRQAIEIVRAADDGAVCGVCPWISMRPA